jgi:hypothetical protein
MAYVTTNSPKCILSGFGGSPSIFVYTSGDAHTIVDDAGYFTNGKAIGMKLGDIVYVVNDTAAAYTATLHAVSVVSAAGAVTISAAVLI